MQFFFNSLLNITDFNNLQLFNFTTVKLLISVNSKYKATSGHQKVSEHHLFWFLKSFQTLCEANMLPLAPILQNI